MKKAMLLILALGVGGPSLAQESDGDRPVPDGLSMMGEGARMVLKGMLDEMGPAWDDLMRLFDDLNAYQPPEVLPNGDIIIRRKVPLATEDEGATDI